MVLWASKLLAHKYSCVMLRRQDEDSRPRSFPPFDLERNKPAREYSNRLTHIGSGDRIRTYYFPTSKAGGRTDQLPRNELHPKNLGLLPQTFTRVTPRLWCRARPVYYHFARCIKLMANWCERLDLNQQCYPNSLSCEDNLRIRTALLPAGRCLPFHHSHIIDWLKQRERPILQSRVERPLRTYSGVHPVHLQISLLEFSFTCHLVDVKQDLAGRDGLSPHTPQGR